MCYEPDLLKFKGRAIRWYLIEKCTCFFKKCDYIIFLGFAIHQAVREERIVRTLDNVKFHGGSNKKQGTVNA